MLKVFYPQALLIGPAVAPLTGGIIAEYVLQIHCHRNLTFIDGTIIPLTDSSTLICRYGSWRLMQVGVECIALLTYFLMYIGMPETSHPGTRGVDKKFGGKFKWVWLNPFKCLWYMRSPNLLALVSKFDVLTDHHS